MALGCVQSIGRGPAGAVRNIGRNGHAQLPWAAIASLVRVSTADVDKQIRGEKGMRDGATSRARRYQLERHIDCRTRCFFGMTVWRCQHEKIAMCEQGNPSVCR